MKSLNLKSNPVMRTSKKKLALVMFVGLSLIQLSACHNKYDISPEVRSLVVDQNSRINHASEILKDTQLAAELNISKAKKY